MVNGEVVLGADVLSTAEVVTHRHVVVVKRRVEQTTPAAHMEHEGNVCLAEQVPERVEIRVRRGTLASKTPIKTVESYWPYATTLFDYVKRSMPFNAPGSLSDEEVYSVVAYILSEAKIITPVEKMDATTLPKVVMPNRDGFEPDPRPEVQLYR